ncbi:MAG TPA: cation transporter [Dyella sp.]|uniref:cation diffusion facilitator family transporter n=1 Tax=Dyella sp. TaxID=1869338 RepID=UPI002D78AE7F|nr:cation transporter [Dyella sp.]HET6553037.1 cation transporter [Dyella sp.]
MDTSREQRQLRLSILVTFLVGVACVVVGLLMHSQAIAFDGFYSLVDVVLTAGSLLVSHLISSEGSRRFQFGYWHLEPLMVMFNATVLTAVCSYAAYTAVHDLLRGGHELAFGFGAAWAAFMGVASMSMAWWMQRQARALDSVLLQLDARGWLIGGCISIAVLVGFAVAAAIKGGPLDHWIRYMDSSILLLLIIVLLPLPLGSLWQALREVLQVAPDALDQRVRTVMTALVNERGYLDFASYVAKIGRMRFIDIHILVDPSRALGTMASVDEVRSEISRRLGSDIRVEWLTIVFTGKREWM